MFVLNCNNNNNNKNKKYKAQDMVVSKPGRFSLVFQPSDGSAKTDVEVFTFKGPGVALGMYNTDEVSRSYL